MANTCFAFKQFTINQEHTAMKVGTDGVLLGAWCHLPPQENRPALRLLDIGTGTGIIALMLAQRSSSALIDAVEVDSESCRDARLNFKHSLWNERITLYEERFQEFVARITSSQTTSSLTEREDPLGEKGGTPHATRYDCIVSNPPYFVNALQAPDAARNRARHTTDLPYHILLKGVAQLLTPEGRFSVILPPAESSLFEQAALEHNLHTIRRLEVHTKPNTPPKRILTEFAKGQWAATLSFEKASLTIRDPSGKEYDAAYKALTSDFYLKF